MTFIPAGNLIQASASSFSLAPVATGDLICLEVAQTDNDTVYATSLSSSNVTWTRVTYRQAVSASNETVALFTGKVTSVTTETVTVSWSGTAPSDIRIAGQEFFTNAPGWGVDATGYIDSTGTDTWASLTPSRSSISLVSQGSIAASGSPSFGAATGANHLLVAFVGSNGSTGSFTTTTSAPGWSLAASGGTAFVWASIWYKPDCASGETAPVFTDSEGDVEYSQLGEYSGAALSSPVDQSGGQFGGGDNPTWAVILDPDTAPGDLVTACGFWNGATGGGAVSITQFTDSTGTPLTSVSQNAANGSGLYFTSLYGITAGTGNGQSFQVSPAGDTAYLALSEFNQGGGVLVSFKPANPVVQPLAIPPQVLPVTWLDFPYSTRNLTAIGGVPPYTWSYSGSLPPGMSLSSSGVLSGTSVTSAGVFDFTAEVTDSASSTATAAQSITVGSPRSPFTTLTTTTSLTGNLGAYDDPSEMTPASNGFTTYVASNQVGPIDFTITLGAYSPSMWYATADAGPAGTGQVQMGPCNSQQFVTWGTGGWNGSSDTPLSGLSSLTATYDVTDPVGGTWELEFDIWTGYTGAGGIGTTVASGSNGGSIASIASWSHPSAGVLDVASATGYPASGALLVEVSGGNTVAIVTYTGISGNSFTGCTYVTGSATGTVSTGGWVAQPNSRDIMLWLDTSPERGTGGAILHTPNLEFGGHMFDFYYYPDPYPDGPIAGAELIFILQGEGGSGTFGHMTSGTVDILGPLNWLVEQGFDLGNAGPPDWTPAAVTPYIDLILFGWEMCNTDLYPAAAATGAQTFICNSFTYDYTLA